MIIGLTGKNGAGKGEVARFLTESGYEYHSLSDILREELASRGEKVTREKLIAIVNELRANYGAGVVAERTLGKLSPEAHAVVDSIRNPFEVEALRRRKTFHLISVDADPKIRFERARLRNREGYGRFKMPIAGKTGTTQNHSDGWFIGVTPRLTAGVWTGAELRSIHFRTISSGQGANMALPIWGYFYKKVLADPTLGYTEEMNFIRPPNFNINLNCDEEEKNKTPTDFNDFF